MKKYALCLVSVLILNLPVLAEDVLVCAGLIYTPSQTAQQYCDNMIQKGKSTLEAFGTDLNEYRKMCLDEFYPDAVKAYKSNKCEKGILTNYTNKNGVKCEKLITSTSKSETCDDGSTRAHVSF